MPSSMVAALTPRKPERAKTGPLCHGLWQVIEPLLSSNRVLLNGLAPPRLVSRCLLLSGLSI